MSATGTGLVQVSLTVHNTLGACLIGFAASCVVYGILLTMVYTYFSTYTSDRTIYRWLVIGVLILETVDQAFIGHLVYYYGIVHFANPEELLKADVTWSFIMQITLGSIVGFFVKTAFCMRVWRFSERNYWVTGVLMALTFLHLAAAMVFSARAFQLPNVFAVAELRTYGTVSLAVGVANDVLIAGALCWYLRRLKTGYRPSDSLINTLVKFAINTGVVTSVVSLSTLLIYNIIPHNNLLFAAPYFLLSKLYAISFLATLNTRRVVRGRGTDRGTTSAMDGTHASARSNRNTNLFHLGTRIPTMTPAETEEWGAPTKGNDLPPFLPPPDKAQFHMEDGVYRQRHLDAVEFHTAAVAQYDQYQPSQRPQQHHQPYYQDMEHSPSTATHLNRGSSARGSGGVDDDTTSTTDLQYAPEYYYNSRNYV